MLPSNQLFCLLLWWAISSTRGPGWFHFQLKVGQQQTNSRCMILARSTASVLRSFFPLTAVITHPSPSNLTLPLWHRPNQHHCCSPWFLNCSTLFCNSFLISFYNPFCPLHPTSSSVVCCLCLFLFIFLLIVLLSLYRGQLCTCSSSQILLTL